MYTAANLPRLKRSKNDGKKSRGYRGKVIVLPRKAYIIYCFTSVSKKWMQFTREHLFDFTSLQHSITINSAQWKVLRGAIETIDFYDGRNDRQNNNL